RGRLSHQAVQPRRAGGAHARAPAARHRSRRQHPAPSRHRARHCDAYRHSRRPDGGLVGARVSAPRRAARAPRRCAVEGAARGAPLSLGRRGREQRHRGARPQPAQEARRRCHSHAARRRLCACLMDSIRRTLLLWLLIGLLAIGVLVSGATYVAARALPPSGGITELVTQIWDRNGVLVYWSEPGMGLPIPETEGYSTVHHEGRDWRVYTMVQGTHALQVAQAQDQRDAIATQTAIRTLVPFVAFLPLFALLIWVGVGRGLAPLRTMSEAVSKRRPDAMAPLNERDLPEELKPLAHSLNELLARLD